MSNDRGESSSFKHKAKKAFEIYTTKRDDDATTRLNIGVVPLILSGGIEAINKRHFNSKALAVDDSSLFKMEGYMDKRCGTGSMGSWRASLYFVINNGFLNYYRHKSELKNPTNNRQVMPTPRGSYDLGLLRRIELVNGGVIRLYFNGWAFKELRAPTINEATKWVKYLNERRKWTLSRGAAEERSAGSEAVVAASDGPDERLSSEECEPQNISEDEDAMLRRISGEISGEEEELNHGEITERRDSEENASESRTAGKGNAHYAMIVTVLEAQISADFRPKNKKTNQNAANPAKSRSSRNPNVYVCLHAGNEAFWTRVRRNTCNPIWEESFVFGISGNPSSNAYNVGDKVLFSVQHTFFHRHELLQKQEFNEIGFVCVDVGKDDMQFNEPVDLNVPVRKSDSESAGTLHVRIQKVTTKAAKQLCSALPGKYRFEPSLSERLFLHRKPHDHSGFARKLSQTRSSSLNAPRSSFATADSGLSSDEEPALRSFSRRALISSNPDPILAFLIMKLGQWADVGVGVASFFLSLMLGVVAILWITMARSNVDDAAPSLVARIETTLVDMTVYPALLGLTCACALRETLYGTLKVVGAVKQLEQARKSKKAACRHLQNIRTIAVLMIVSVLLLLHRIYPHKTDTGVNTNNTIATKMDSVVAAERLDYHEDDVYVPTRSTLHMHDGHRPASMWERCYLDQLAPTETHRQEHEEQNLTHFLTKYRVCDPHPPSKCKQKLTSNDISRVSDLWLIKEDEWMSVVGLNLIQSRRMHASLDLLAKLQNCHI